MNDSLLIHRRATGGTARAGIHVDQQHPYFFDHPLDHTPGVLLLEAFLQAAELVAPLGDPACVVRDLEAVFHHFVDPGRPASVEVSASGGVCQGRIVQGARTACRFRIATGPSTPPQAPSREGEPALERAPVEPALVHKRRAENVLIGELVLDDAEHAACALLPPPPGHLLAARHLSPVYAAEVHRQCHTLLAHRAGVSLQAQMVLRSIRAHFERPLRRDVPLHLRLEGAAPRRMGPFTATEARATFLDSRGVVGTSEHLGHLL